jgi:hypothetical protein
MNKTAFLISVALAAFVLVSVAGIAYAVRAADKPQEPTTTLPVPTSDPAIEQAFQEREAAYQDLIAQANARLEQAQKREIELQAQLAAQQPGDQPGPDRSTLTPEEAVAVAVNFLGQTSVYTVETTTVRGENLYMVTFSSGDIVYVSMDGQVTGSVAAPVEQVQVNRSVQQGGHGEYEEHEEHEEHEEGHDD